MKIVITKTPLLFTGLALTATLLSTGCATTETHKSIKPEPVATYGTSYQGVKTTLAVGAFENSSTYMQGMFSSNNDKLGNQAKTILKTHLQQTNRFKVVDRENLNQLAQEAKFNKASQNIKGANYLITGNVTEFGRKVTGDHQLFGILGSGKKQTAYTKVSLNVVDVTNSEIIYSTQGAGEYALDSREVVGFGSTAGYDSTLNGKVLNLAIQEAVNNMARDLENGALKVKP